MDAIDVALVEIEDEKLSVVSYEQFPFQENIRKSVRELSSSSTIDEITRLDCMLGRLFARSILKLLERSGVPPHNITAIGSHGQTVLHLPDIDPARTLQIGDANIIAFETGITTVADFRRMDMAAGGQGAPLAPAFHAFQFSSDTRNRVILNLGGMANITILPKNKTHVVNGFDTGPGNALLDDWAQQYLGQAYDKNGTWAASGVVDNTLLKMLLEDQYFRLEPPKSTGRDYFNLVWLNNILASLQTNPVPADVQATLTELTASTISNAIKKHAANTDEVLVCGGGVHNPVLMKSLAEKLQDMTVLSTNEYGLDPDCIEAVAFAWLARCRMNEIPVNLTSITGAASPQLLGAIYGIKK